MLYVPCYAVEDMDCLMDNELAIPPYYGLCQELSHVILDPVFLFIIFSIHDQCVIIIPSHQTIVLTLSVLDLYTFSNMYLHAVDFAVLLIFLYVSTRVKFPTYCWLVLKVYISTRLNQTLSTPRFNFLSIVLCFQYLTSPLYLNSLPIHYVNMVIGIVFLVFLLTCIIWLHTTNVFVPTFVLVFDLGLFN